MGDPTPCLSPGGLLRKTRGGWAAGQVGPWLHPTGDRHRLSRCCHSSFLQEPRGVRRGRAQPRLPSPPAPRGASAHRTPAAPPGRRSARSGSPCGPAAAGSEPAGCWGPVGPARPPARPGCAVGPAAAAAAVGRGCVNLGCLRRAQGLGVPGREARSGASGLGGSFLGAPAEPRGGQQGSFPGARGSPISGKPMTTLQVTATSSQATPSPTVAWPQTRPHLLQCVHPGLQPPHLVPHGTVHTWGQMRHSVRAGDPGSQAAGQAGRPRAPAWCAPCAVYTGVVCPVCGVPLRSVPRHGLPRRCALTWCARHGLPRWCARGVPGMACPDAVCPVP